ncbi:hypothetical protein [Ramlibacter sp.]|uniref:hypothetical protein n=1 Tax=Ramlibacter sp. TaxID=1917967 RepID=UPI002FC5C227
MSTTFADATDPAPQQQRSRMFWMVLGALAAGQLVAFWLVCSHQVRIAEARQNEWTVQQMALSDCLQYIPGSTIASCSGRNDAASARSAQANASVNRAVAGAQPVSYNYR